MIRPRDRASAKGLLPRMEARPNKDGTITYRYRLNSGRWQPLGTDKAAAIRQVLDLLDRHTDTGTIGRLWEQYQETTYWSDLKPRTQKDYTAFARELLKVFADVQASAITAPIVSRYLRVERAKAPKRANREIRFLSVLLQLAIERGEATHNPCRDRHVRFNKERPRTLAPDPADMAALVAHAHTKGRRWPIIAMAAEFCALTGPRQMEFLPLVWPAFDEEAARWERGKQRKGVVLRERIGMSAALAELRGRLLAYQTSPMGPVFPNQHGNAYTGDGFRTQWQKLMRECIQLGLVKRRFTFHDLRAHYATVYKDRTGDTADMHANPATTVRVYERSNEAKRNAL